MIPMKVTSARYVLLDVDGSIRADDAGGGWPKLMLEIDGMPADVFEPKRNLLGLGYVFIGAEWEDRLEPLELHHDPSDPRTPDGILILRGFTCDPVVVQLARNFADAVDSDTFKPGPVRIPDGCDS
jgi:hypothetical protein